MKSFDFDGEQRGKFLRFVFLDFDGVLHPAGAAPGTSLPFCWVPVLAAELETHQDVGIVIHSSWIERSTIEDFREFLAPLGLRVVGTVIPGSKAEAILAYLRGHPEILRWPPDGRLFRSTSTFSQLDLVVANEQSKLPSPRASGPRR